MDHVHVLTERGAGDRPGSVPYPDEGDFSRILFPVNIWSFVFIEIKSTYDESYFDLKSKRFLTLIQISSIFFEKIYL